MDEPRPEAPSPPDRIELGDGAYLRLYIPDDAGMVFEAVDCDRERLRPWFPWVDETHGPDDTRAFIEASIAPGTGSSSMGSSRRAASQAGSASTSIERTAAR